jgi:hypothetical protein
MRIRQEAFPYMSNRSKLTSLFFSGAVLVGACVADLGGAPDGS